MLENTPKIVPGSPKIAFELQATGYKLQHDHLYQHDVRGGSSCYIYIYTGHTCALARALSVCSSLTTTNLLLGSPRWRCKPTTEASLGILARSGSHGKRIREKLFLKKGMPPLFFWVHFQPPGSFPTASQKKWLWRLSDL